MTIKRDGKTYTLHEAELREAWTEYNAIRTGYDVDYLLDMFDENGHGQITELRKQWGDNWYYKLVDEIVAYLIEKDEDHEAYYGGRLDDQQKEDLVYDWLVDEEIIKEDE